MTPRDVEYKVVHIFCGLGGGKKGFNRSTARVGHLSGRFRTIGGFDSDPAAIADFDRMGPGRGTVLDLFSRDQYIKFHGKEPPSGWRAATPVDLRVGCGGEYPDIAFGSAPCKGFSGLLSERSSQLGKYQALNALAIRGLRLGLEAWKDDPPSFWLWENVPRIASRGRAILDEMIELLEAFGYVVAETTHNCGELGGLAQSRPRFLLVARHPEKVPPFLYEPPKRPLLAVGDVLGRLPLPGHATAGPMHRQRSLQRKTWERLAFVKAGSDWRSLRDLRVKDGFLEDYCLMPEVRWHNGALGVHRWTDTAGTVTSTARPHNGANAVADPRPGYSGEYQQLGVNPWDKPMGVVSGQSAPGGGAYSIADVRYEKFGQHYGKMRVEDWSEPAHVVTGSDRVGSGALSIGDPRIPAGRNDRLGVRGWNDHAHVVSGEGLPSNGANAVADPRPAQTEDRGAYGIVPWDTHTGTIIGVRAPGQGYFSTADPRPRFNNVYRVVRWDEVSPAVTGGSGPSSGGLAIADARPGYPESTHTNILRVTKFSEPARVIGGALHPAGGAQCVADPRTGIDRVDGADYATARHYGVLPWHASSGAVTGSAGHDNGMWSLADPRIVDSALDALPGMDEKCVLVIIALDGTYHRPFTTLELAVIQSLIDPEEYLHFNRFDGTSDTAWRERIGNAVPPDAAEAIGNVMLQTLLLAQAGETFTLSAMPVWVQPFAVSVSLDPTRLEDQ